MEVLMMDETKRDPREDISLIREMLERAMDGMKPAAPWFTGFGLIWLVYGLFSVVQRLVMSRVPLETASKLAFAGSVAGILFCLVLAVGFPLCRSRQSFQDMEPLGRKLVDMWGVCIYLFLLATLLISPVIRILSVRMGFSQDASAALNMACALSRSFLFFLFPAAPLLITAKFLDSRRMFAAGIVLTAAAVMVVCSHGVVMFDNDVTVGMGWYYAWLIGACLLDLAPGMMLLVFGQQLKER